MADSACVTAERRDRVVVLTITHPPANALNAQVLESLQSHVATVCDDAQVKAVVVTGAGPKFFVAGADINELDAIATAEAGRALAARGQRIFDAIEHADKPFIAAVNGIAVGGGCELAMACHLRIASDNAKFGQPEINLGIIPGYGGTQRLPRLIGRTHAMEWILTGRMIDAADAAALGLVNRTVPAGQALDAALDLANQIAGKGARAVAAAMRAVRAAGEQSSTDGMATEAELFGAVCTTADKKEGVRAFLEKRAARFTDQ